MRNTFLYLLLLCNAIVSQPWSPPQPMHEDPSTMDSSQAIADRIVASKIPVLIDFWAPWCGPCRMLGPTIEDLKKEYKGKIQVMKVNVDINRSLSAFFKISSIPAVFLVANKAVIEYLPGLQPKEAYKKAIEKALKTPVKPSSGETKQDTPTTQQSGKASTAGIPAPVARDR
jgi:thioredoxin 1